jgi:2-polyprenyl-3-methyl-5-hydroxy-6-metoxy-1,4-benzoquinol methylase
MLGLARRHVPEGKYYRKDITRVKFKPGSFDAVISFFALNHLSKRQFKGVLVSCKTFLKKDGLLMLGMVKGKNEGLFERFYGEKLALYGAGYSRKELTNILKSNGYRILKTGTKHFKGKYFEEDDIYVLAQVVK